MWDHQREIEMYDYRCETGLLYRESMHGKQNNKQSEIFLKNKNTTWVIIESDFEGLNLTLYRQSTIL